MEPRRFSVGEVHHFALSIAKTMRSSMRQTSRLAQSKFESGFSMGFSFAPASLSTLLNDFARRCEPARIPL